MGKTFHVCDFESASVVDLKKVGAWAYAEHPTTEVLCLSFEYGAEKKTWAPTKYREKDVGPLLWELVDDPEVIFVSHGDFERAMWACIMVYVYGFPPLPNERWHDTMAVAGMKQVPLDLDMLTKTLGSPIGKDKEGSKFTRSLSKPNKKTGMLDRSPASLARVYTYCESDVGEERWVLNRLGFLTPEERRVWLLDQKINQRGVGLDLDYVRACQKVVDGAMVPLAKEFAEITGGLEITQVKAIMEWIDRGLGPLSRIIVPDLKKETIAGLLGGDIDAPDEDDDGEPSGDPGVEGRSVSKLTGPVARALTIRQLGGSASVKKLGTMLACVSMDGRARGLLQYHRAGPGRWGARLLQPHNFPRPSLKVEGVGKDGKPEEHMQSVDMVVSALLTGDWEYVEMVCGPAIQTVVHGLRHAIKAKRGNGLISGDYMQIEARIVLALAGQADKVALFLTGTPYQDMAQTIYGRPVSKKTDIAEYTIGKNTVLGCGFGMGAATFFDRYCPNQSIDFAERVIRIYRKEWAPFVPPVWYALDEAASETVWTGIPHEAYGCEYALEDGWLTCRIPSGRKLYYWNPQKEEREMPWSTPEKRDIRPSFTYQAKKAGVMRTIYAFGGLLTENVVQALARDVLVYGMFNLEANGFPLVLTVHDEALSETGSSRLDEKAYTQIMSERPQWAVAMNVPIGVETWVGDRYRK